MYAVESESVESVRRLLESGVNPDVGAGEPLRYAAASGQATTVKTLLDYGATVDLPDRDGVTALMMACGQGHREVVVVLLERGASPVVRDRQGRSARDYAKQAPDQIVAGLIRLLDSAVQKR